MVITISLNLTTGEKIGTTDEGMQELDESERRKQVNKMQRENTHDWEILKKMNFYSGNTKFYSHIQSMTVGKFRKKCELVNVSALI